MKMVFLAKRKWRNIDSMKMFVIRTPFEDDVDRNQNRSFFPRKYIKQLHHLLYNTIKQTQSFLAKTSKINGKKTYDEYYSQNDK